MDVTLLEVHMPDAEFIAPFAGREVGSDDARTGWSPAGGGPSPRLGPVAAVLALVGLALLARYLRGSGAEQTTLDEVQA